MVVVIDIDIVGIAVVVVNLVIGVVVNIFESDRLNIGRLQPEKCTILKFFNHCS